MRHQLTNRSILLQLSILLVLFLLPLSGCSTQPPPKTETATAASNGGDLIAESDSCPVCGMSPAAFPKWQSVIMFKDYSRISFDSPRDMLIFVNNMDNYDQRHNASDIDKILVRDYATADWVDAHQAHFVAGSAVKGPMGEEFIPFAKLETARQFIMSKSGQFFALRQIDNDVLHDFIPSGQFSQ